MISRWSYSLRTRKAVSRTDCISSLNTQGILVALAATVTVGQRLVIQNSENWAERSGRVARVDRCYAGRTEVGIEFTEPAPDFWLVPAEISVEGPWKRDCKYK